MGRSKIDVANEALVMTGNTQIAEFDDGSAEGVAVSAHYETVIGSALLNPGGGPFRWSFATRQDALTQLAGSPDARWHYAYQMPIDCLRLHAVTERGYPVAYGTHGQHIVTDSTGPLVADYSFRAREEDWPPDFLQAVTIELAARLALTLNENADLAAGLRKLVQWQGVRTGDSQARSSTRLRAGRLTGARHGGMWSRR
jgi:hypothetical protein